MQAASMLACARHPVHTAGMHRLLAFLLIVASSVFAAEKRELWIYKSTNLLVDKNVDELATLLGRAAKAGYTHMLLTDSKFSRLGEMDGRYFKNVERVKTLALQNAIEIVPALFPVGYSNSILSQDVNLIEALPVKNVPLVVKGGAAVVADAEAPVFRDGGFDDRKRWAFVDETVVFENGTARVTDPKEGRARLSAKIKVTPWRQYHISVRIKTEGFRGSPEIKALPEKGASLCHDHLGVKPTQDWQTHHAVFNSQENTQVGIYFGTWDAQGGSLWWDDAKIEEVAFLNMPRRDGCPLVITTADGKPLAEGTDFEPLRDPLLGTKPYAGEYDVFHTPPVLRTKLPDGTKLLASYYHAATVHDGQAMICPSEPKTVGLLRQQARDMHRLWGAKGYMMSHDEIRVLNHCAACRARSLTPGEIIADNVRTCTAILREINPGGRIYVWSDMFDPAHNAVAGPYYLVNGPLTGSWDGLAPEVIVLPWYFEKREASLGWFANRGHKQLIAGYYDGKPGKIKDWLTAAEKIPGVVGVMYTTWVNKYADLETFAEAAK
ncbi:MAG: hypothetical protein RL088_586 [Verrucomicrobiota bacterium]|jgi:hypothetical protein